MSGFLFALVAVLLASMGARDQLLVAQLSARLGQRPALLAIAIATGALAAVLAGLAVQELAPDLQRGPRLLLAAIALAAGGMESLVLARPKLPNEPTRSLFAAAIVLFAHQLTDAGRLLIFAIAATSGARLAVAGGALGGALALGIGWLGGQLLLEARGLLRGLRALSGALLLLAAVIVWMIATGRI